jgi:hypothetical protein
MLGMDAEYGEKWQERRYANGAVFVCMTWLRRNEMEVDRWMELLMPVQRPERVNSCNTADAANEDRAGMQRDQ